MLFNSGNLAKANNIQYSIWTKIDIHLYTVLNIGRHPRHPATSRVILSNNRHPRHLRHPAAPVNLSIGRHPRHPAASVEIQDIQLHQGLSIDIQLHRGST